MRRLVICSLMVLTLLPATVDAQNFFSRNRNRSFILNVGTGTSSYFGELSNDGDYMDTKLNFNVGLQYPLSDRAFIRTDVTWFQLQGDDAEADSDSRKTRNLSFRSNNLELAVTGTVNILPNGNRFYQRRPVNFYGFAGLALTWYSPTAELNGERHALRSLKTEGVDYGPVTFAIPFGLGTKIRASSFLNFVIEGGYRITFTDYLDDVSTVHVDINSFSDPIAAALSDRRPEIGLETRPAGSIRGNPDSNDGYFILSAKVEYYLPYGFLSKFINPSRRFKRSHKRR